MPSANVLNATSLQHVLTTLLPTVDPDAVYIFSHSTPPPAPLTATILEANAERSGALTLSAEEMIDVLAEDLLPSLNTLLAAASSSSLSVVYYIHVPTVTNVVVDAPPPPRPPPSLQPSPPPAAPGSVAAASALANVARGRPPSQPTLDAIASAQTAADEGAWATLAQLSDVLLPLALAVGLCICLIAFLARTRAKQLASGKADQMQPAAKQAGGRAQREPPLGGDDHDEDHDEPLLSAPTTPAVPDSARDSAYEAQYAALHAAETAFAEEGTIDAAINASFAMRSSLGLNRKAQPPQPDAQST